MSTQRIMLILLAIVLVGLSLWVHLSPAEQGWRPQSLDAAALAALQPDAEGDQRLLEHLRSLGGTDPAGWKDLPTPGNHLFATLWAEEIHRTGSWAQMTEVDPQELTGPTPADIAAAYDALGLSDKGTAVRRLAAAFDRDRIAVQAWVGAMRAGTAGKRPLARDTDAAAKAAFGRLDAVRARRLALVRTNPADLGIR